MVSFRDGYVLHISGKQPLRIHPNLNTAARRHRPLCREGGLTVYSSNRERLQGPWPLELVGHTVRSKPQDKNGGGLSGRASVAEQDKEDSPAVRKVNVVPWPTGEP